VWRGTWRHGQLSDTVAIKRVVVGSDDAGQLKSAAVWDEREVAFMMNITHPRVVSFLGAGEDTILGCPTLLMVQEYMSGGSIDRRLWKTPPESLSWKDKLRWGSDIAEGMAFIHHRGFAHRDLKSPNVLYEGDNMRAKVADFGMARSTGAQIPHPGFREPRGRGRETAADASSHDVSVMTSQIGTTQWMAPELCAASLKASDKLDSRVARQMSTFWSRV